MQELTRTVQADANGRISMPLVGEIDATGKTPAEITDIIQTRLASSYLRNPQVTVNVAEIGVQGSLQDFRAPP